jgi:rSAM/selenodomain-associated transferase 1
MIVRAAREAGRKDTCAIAVMAKASIPGRTKTRLSPPLTRTEASELNTAFLVDIAENLACVSELAHIASFVAFGPPESTRFFEDHLPAHFGLMGIWFDDLGECLHQTAKAIFGLGYSAAVLLNSDSPTLPTQILLSAAAALAAPGERVVLGPCEDGGYYLLGVKSLHERLFEDIAWSTDQVARQTLERAAELELKTIVLPTWYDVDDVDSLKRLFRETLVDPRQHFGDQTPFFPSQTAAALRRLLGTEDFAKRLDPSLRESLTARIA